ncbi:MAG: hypothetical protein HZY79_02160 [Rhodoblastus sp.]|nr:MAG: hypothetical protein HZY79_02160 [Rhodoblastus sp.]
MNAGLALGPPPENAKPRERVGRSRGISKVFSLAANTDETKPSFPPTQPEFASLGAIASVVVARLAQRCRITAHHARVAAELNGLVKEAS